MENNVGKGEGKVIYEECEGKFMTMCWNYCKQMFVCLQ